MADDRDTVGDVAQIVRVGRIASVDRDAALCRVALGDPDSDDGEVETDDIPWGGFRAGRMTVWSPPTVGEQILLIAPGGDIGQAVAVPGLYSTDFPAPGNGAREFMRFDDGAEFGYDPDTGAADITLPDGGTLTIKAVGGVSIEGDVAIKGNVAVEGGITATEDIEAGDISLQKHKHSGVQAGGAQTGAPA